MASPDPSIDPQEIQSRANFVDDIHGKSDRAVAIVGSALLSTHLDQLLRSFFIDDPAEAQDLLGEDSPLGGFGARIRLAYALGLISREERQDLWSIHKIAHFFIREMEELSFRDDPLGAWCLALDLPNRLMVPGESRKPRRMFVFAVALLARQLALRIDQAEKERRSPASPFKMVEVKK